MLNPNRIPASDQVLNDRLISDKVLEGILADILPQCRTCGVTFAIRPGSAKTQCPDCSKNPFFWR